ncbi:hypothetical protein ACFWB0_11080 [Rhodococcus sp. NPDC060086]|uniref:hypothetical protein n=1 Tax=Rhodococcus sp. NPDC060086 TaxID=3347055 RepID=UPI0036578742
MQVLAYSIADHFSADSDARANADQFLRQTVAPEFKKYALTETAPYINNWVGGGA